MRSNTSFSDQLAFDLVAEEYEQWRTTYPDTLVQDILKLGNLREDSRILDIGAGTGQLSLPFARHGLEIDAIEPSPNLARILRTKLKAFPQSSIIEGTFEDVFLTQHHYDCVVSANAFHWVRPEIGYSKVHQICKPGALVALLWSFPILKGDEATVLRKTFDQLPKQLRMFLEEDDGKAQMAEGLKDMQACGFFNDLTERAYEWTQTLTGTGFCKYLTTYANYAKLDPGERERILRIIRNAIDGELGGAVTMTHMGYVRLGRTRA